MSDLYKRVVALCKEEGLTQQQLCEKLGLANGSVGKWKKYNPQTGTVRKLAEFFGVSTTYLLEGSDGKDDGIWIPVLGTVAAGIPISAVENIEGYEEIPKSLARSGEFFGLRIKGDSMAPRIQDGDVVIVKKQDVAQTGDIVIAKVNGDDATCKKFKETSDGIILMPLNPAYDPMVYTFREVEEVPVTIVGKVIELRAKL